MKSLILTFLPTLIISFLVTFLTTPIIGKIAALTGIVDKPTDRKIHKAPTPLLGGIAIFLGFVLSVSFSMQHTIQFWGILIGGLIILITGILDDTLGMNPWIKLSGQIITAVITFYFGIGIHFITNPFGGILQLQWMALPITIIWLVSMMNTINLIDGLDGLASGLTAISSLILSIVAIQTQQPVAAILTVALLGSNLAFLKYNFSPAKIFMGDSGSMFLGYILGISSIIGVLKSTTTLSLAIPILVLGIPISDTLFAIIRRIKNGQGIFKADNGHFHHKMMDVGLTQKQVVIVCYIISILLGGIAYWVSISTCSNAAIILTFTIIIIYSALVFLRKKHKSIVTLLSLFF